LYDQELSYIIDNPYGSALFLLRMVRIEGQEHDNQMPAGVIQSELISHSFASGHTLADLAGNCCRCRWRFWKDTKQGLELLPLILKIVIAEGRRA